jgi:acyl-CoA reductase-like NAD-dependent aldehyde dehydrogenase
MKPQPADPLQPLRVECLANRDRFEFDPVATCAEMRSDQTVWAATPLRTRSEVMRRFRHLLVEQAGLVARTTDSSQQRSLAEIYAAEIIPLADACRFLEREAQSILSPRRLGRNGRPVWIGGVESEIRREPFGLVLVVAPSNYPIFLPGVQILQALVAGNSVLLKPGPGGLKAALQLARLLRAAKLPGNLLHVLDETPEAARAAIEAGVDKVIFTGSAAVGKQVLAQLASHAVPSTMELSGCDAAIVRADADLDLAVRALVFGLRLNSGQTCIAPRRVFVARTVATEFEGRLARALAGCAAAEFSPAQQHKLAPLLLQALASGAHLLAGRTHSESQVIGPVVIAGLNANSPLHRQDIFGPLLLLATVASDDEAIELTNESSFGLGATIFSRDERAARTLASRLQVGVVVINDMIAPTADPRLPFGGRKLSGFGVTRGREGLLEMTTHKVVVINRASRRPHLDAPERWHEKLFPAFLRLAHGRNWAVRLRGLKDLIQALSERKTHQQK